MYCPSALPPGVLACFLTNKFLGRPGVLWGGSGCRANKLKSELWRHSWPEPRSPRPGLNLEINTLETDRQALKSVDKFD